MYGLKESSINLHHKNLNETNDINKDEAHKTYENIDSKEKIMNSIINKNNYLENTFDINYFEEYNNSIFLYYSSTINYLKRSNNNNINTFYSKNFIPKIKNNIIPNEEKYNNAKIHNNKNINYIIDNNRNKTINKNTEHNKYSFSQNRNDDLNQQFKFFDKSTININTSIEDNKINKNDLLESNDDLIIDHLKNIKKGNESCSTSSKTSPTFSEKTEKPTNFFSLNYSENLINGDNQNYEENEFLVEMFGRKGWICILCNNFNYETRVKCNRCGVMKNPKRIFEKKIKIDNKKNNFKERGSKKGDWICSNCKNLNYSFRAICNRCKFPKNYLLINYPINCKKDIKNNNDIFSSFYLSPNFIVFNNIPNIFINNIENNREKEK